MLTALQLAERSCADLVQEEAKDFRVHARVYTDPLLYEQEMRQIFEKSWIYIGHESEVAHPGDYRGQGHFSERICHAGGQTRRVGERCAPAHPRPGHRQSHLPGSSGARSGDAYGPQLLYSI